MQYARLLLNSNHLHEGAAVTQLNKDNSAETRRMNSKIRTCSLIISARVAPEPEHGAEWRGQVGDTA